MSAPIDLSDLFRWAPATQHRYSACSTRTSDVGSCQFYNYVVVLTPSASAIRTRSATARASIFFIINSALNLDGHLAHIENTGDLLVQQSRCDKREHLALPRRERFKSPAQLSKSRRLLGCHRLPARIWHCTNASFVSALRPPRFEYQLRPSVEIPPPFCTAQRQPSLSCILLHRESRPGS
jgi:hypothetical protein